MQGVKNRYCIVGIGHTPFGKNPGVSQVAHNVLAIRAALEDAGLAERLAAWRAKQTESVPDAPEDPS